MIELATKRFIVIADERKLVDKLGTLSPLPVEVIQFGWRYLAGRLEKLGCAPRLRGGEAEPYVTDNGNYILDCHFPTGIDEPAALAVRLREQPGVVEHGLFLGMADEAVVAMKDGIKILK
jgi:ribose 5-phosphate isomerase A